MHGEPLAASEPQFRSYESCNAAAEAYLRASTAAERDACATDLYRRLLPLVRKTLRRFCPPGRYASRCGPGQCLPEELVGESYLAFQELLERYDPSLGLDFLGYAAQRLYWALDHQARRLERFARRENEELVADVPAPATPEDDLLRGLAAWEALSHVDPREATLLVRDAAGFSCQEIGAEFGISAAAVRKRLERVRRRVREASGTEET